MTGVGSRHRPRRDWKPVAASVKTRLKDDDLCLSRYLHERRGEFISPLNDDDQANANDASFFPPHEHLPRKRTLLSTSVKHEGGVVRHRFAFACAANQRTRVAHSITSSARARSVGGMVRPRALAVLRLMTSSNLVGCSIGRSAGLAPLRILSTCVAACRYMSDRPAP